MNTASLKEMMKQWNATFAAVRDQFPAASDEEAYRITKLAFDRSLGL